MVYRKKMRDYKTLDFSVIIWYCNIMPNFDTDPSDKISPETKGTLRLLVNFACSYMGAELGETLTQDQWSTPTKILTATIAATALSTITEFMPRSKETE